MPPLTFTTITHPKHPSPFDHCASGPLQRVRGASWDRLTLKWMKFRFQDLFLAWAPLKKYLIMLFNVPILKKPPHVL